MTREGAESAITGSALVVGGIYVYRRLSEVNVVDTGHGVRLKQIAGIGPVPPTGPFVVGWGFTFLVVSIMAQINPKLGGTFAVLVAAGAVLANGESVSKDITKGLAGAASNTGNAGAGGGLPSSGSPAPAGTYRAVVQGRTVPQGGYTVEQIDRKVRP